MATNNTVSVAVDIGFSVILFKFNKDDSLDAILNLLCDEYKISYNQNKFSFQFIRDHHDRKLKDKYVTEVNRKNIVDGTELKLVYSPSELTAIIYCYLVGEGDLCWALEKLASYVDDPVFVTESFSSCFPIVVAMVNNEKLPPKLYNFCLKIILGYFRFDLIQELGQELIKQLLRNINSDKRIEHAIIENSLRLLELCVSKNEYNLIADAVEIDDLIPLLWDRDSPVIQECTLALINNIAYYCRHEPRQRQILNVMNSAKFRSTISSNVLYPGSEPNDDLAQQLFICQNLILNLLSDLLEPVSIEFHQLPDAAIVSGNKRYSNLESSASDSVIDCNTESSGSSTRSSKELPHNDRISFSWKSDCMHSKQDSLVASFLNLELNDFNKEIKQLEQMSAVKTINKLTYNCIMYFSKRYRRNYQCCLVTEGCNNFVIISNDLINLIIHNILHIGEMRISRSTTYLPLVFSATNKQPFLEELFCMTFCLFERTKKEMRAETYDDYMKVLRVLERQLTEGIMSQPKTFNELQMILRGFKYEAVSEQWLIEWKAKQEHFINKSIAVKELRVSLKEDMTEIIKNQRITYVCKGSNFPVWNCQRHHKNKNKFWFARISNNKKFILYSNNVPRDTEELKDMKSLCLRDVEEFITGKKCPHIKDCKWAIEKPENPLAFSLITDMNENKSLNFVADSREMYDYWVDALNILLGNKMKSNLYHEELNILLNMEIRIKLLDLEGVDCPNEPPPLPQLPDDYEFNF